MAHAKLFNKQHWQAIAAAMKSNTLHFWGDREVATYRFLANTFSEDNPAFDFDKFYVACGGRENEE